MGSKSRVQVYTRRAQSARSIEDKLDSIAKAIEELADFIDDIENQIARK